MKNEKKDTAEVAGTSVDDQINQELNKERFIKISFKPNHEVALQIEGVSDPELAYAAAVLQATVMSKLLGQQTALMSKMPSQVNSSVNKGDYF